MSTTLGVKAGGWLAHRVDEATKEVASWPEWMKASARFEGDTREGGEGDV